MPTVIDSLLVTLGLDPKGFKKGVEDSTKAIKPLTDAQKKQADEESRQAKERERLAKNAAQGVAKIRNEVLGLAAAYVGTSAIKSFVERITESDARLGFFSRNVGMSTQDLSAWQGVAEKTGGSAQSLAGDFRSVTSAVERFGLTGKGGESFQYWRALGINLTDAEGKARSMNDVMLEAADKFQGMDPVKAQALGAGMGLSEGTVNVLLHGRKALLDLLEAQRASNVVTEKDAEQAQARVLAWNALTDVFVRMGKDVLNVLSPAIVALLETMKRFAPAIAAVGVALVALKLATVIRTIGALAAGFTAAGAAATGPLAAGLGVASTAAVGLLGILGKLAGLFSVGFAGFEFTRFLMELGKDESGRGLGDRFMGDIGSKLYDAVHSDDGSQQPLMESRTGARTAAPARTATKPAPSKAANNATGSAAELFGRLETSFGLPPGLLDAVWAQESGRGKNMRSPVGAQGHFQFMPKTAAEYGLKDPNDLTQSATAAARMYHNLLKQYGGDLSKALAGYNFGTGNVQKFGMNNLPRETQKYIASIRGNMHRSSGSTSTTDVKVGQVIVHTKATDANGIARDMGQSLKNYAFATQANLGLS